MAYTESVSEEAKVVADFVESLAGDKRHALISEAYRLMFRQQDMRVTTPPCQCWITWRGETYECAECFYRRLSGGLDGH